MSRPLRRCAALAFALSLSGCSCAKDKTHVLAPVFEIHDVAATTTDPSNGPILGNSDPVAFGAVKVGLLARHSVALVNTGDMVLKVEDPTLEKGTDFTISRSLAPCTGDSADPHAIEVEGCRLVTLQLNPSAVGDYQDTLHLVSDDVNRPTVDLKVTASGANGSLQVCISSAPGADTGLALDSCSSSSTKELTMDFGLTPVGGEVSRRVQLSNVGPVDLDLDGMKTAVGDPADFGIEPADLRAVMHPGDVTQATIVYRPSAIGTRNATATVTADDPATAPVVIHLASQGDGPRLCLDPTSLDFGSVAVGTTSAVKTISLKSCGTQPVTTSALALEGDADFQFAGGAPTTGPIPAGEQVDVALQIQPSAQGPKAAKLMVSSNDPAGPIQFAPLSASAVPPAVCKLEASATTIDFGAQVQATSSTRTLTLHNAGSSDCTISAEALDANSASVRFYIAASPPPPFVMRPNTLVSVDITYNPVDANPPDTGTLAFQTSDPSLANGLLIIKLQGSPEATPACHLDVSPAAGAPPNGRQLNFGVVAIGDKKKLDVTLKNTGNADCTVQKPAFGMLTDASFSFSALTPALPATLHPGDTETIEVAFTPTGPVSVPGFLEFMTVATSENVASECGSTPGCKQVFLTGSGVTLAIDTVPGALDFGLVTVGCNSAEKIVTIYNVGGADVTLTGFAIDPTTAPFTISQQPATPLTLHPGDSTAVRVRYRPSAAAPDSAMLVISHNFSSGTSTVPLKGTGTAESHQTDQFQQNTEPKTDVIWVIDNSGSMSDKQDYLGQNARTFISQANQSQNDYQVAVIPIEWSGSADTGFPHIADSNSSFPGTKINPGQFFGSPQVIRRTDADPAGELEKNIKIGDCCADDAESGLEASKAALTNPLISDPSQPNSTFLREDAKLAIIVLSDEEDQGASQSVQYYVDLIQQLKGAANTQLFAFHAIVGDVPNGCDATVNGVEISADPGKRYMEAVTRTNGIFRSICTTDWGKIAQDIGLDAFAARAQFFLTRTPDTTTLTVTVDGNPQTAGVDYDYDSTSNSIIFRASSTPAAGSDITADYDAACF